MRRGRLGLGAALTATVLLVSLLLSGCTGGAGSSGQATQDPSGAASSSSPAPNDSPNNSPSGSPGGLGSYVALGDSYTAGPFVPTTDLAGGCLRSDHNYPHLLASRLGVTSLRDVSCSGASTQDVFKVYRPVPQARIAPQLQAVKPDTGLVTVGLGGNDFGLFATLVGTCARLRGGDPTGDPCTRALARRGQDPAALAQRISTRVTAVLRAVRSRAPHARVLLVGYPRLVPASGTCPQLPLAAGDYAEGRRISAALNRALAAAAKRTRADFVDMYAASKGHDICSADPWVNGRRTDRARALAYHPFESGMAAVARQVERTLAPR